MLTTEKYKSAEKQFIWLYIYIYSNIYITSGNTDKVKIQIYYIEKHSLTGVDNEYIFTVNIDCIIYNIYLQ